MARDLPILRQTLGQQIGEVLTLLARRHVRANAAGSKIMNLVDVYTADLQARPSDLTLAREIWAEGQAAGPEEPNPYERTA